MEYEGDGFDVIREFIFIVGIDICIWTKEIGRIGWLLLVDFG